MHRAQSSSACAPAAAPLRLFLALAVALLGLGTATPALPAANQEDPVRIKVVGGLAGVSQYVRYEEPFWSRRIAQATGGRVQAEIAPFDRSGIRGQEMLQLMRLGVVPFGTVLLSLVGTEEPELSAPDLPALSPDIVALRRTVALYRTRLQAILASRYGVELLAVYTYPSQVVFCRRPFAGLADLSGRRIRTSSVGQSEVMTALGAVPVVTPFADIRSAMRSGVVECAITGTLSGNAIGLHEMTSHVHAMAISWGLSVFGANRDAWNALPEDLRETIKREVAGLEREIWEAADHETGDGLACNTGQPSCAEGRRGTMSLVPVTEADEARRRSLLTEVVLPAWIRRCGPDCAEAWNRWFAPALGIRVRPD